MPWLRWIALAWPLLPAAWRARVSPAAAATLVSLGLPWAERLLAMRRRAPLPTAAGVDLSRYMGTWFEIARLPEPFEAGCSGQPSAHYSIGDGLVRVVNRCPARAGGERISRGIARVVPGSSNTKLKVTFAPAWLRWLPPVWGDYWVLHVDAAYRVAVVGHPNRRYLWFLSRSPQLPPERLAALRQIAAERGFAVERMVCAVPEAV